MSRRSTWIVGVVAVAALAGLYGYQQTELASMQTHVDELSKAKNLVAFNKEWSLKRLYSEFDLRGGQAILLLRDIPQNSVNPLALSNLKTSVTQLDEAVACAAKKDYECVSRAGYSGFEHQGTYIWYGAAPALLQANLKQARLLQQAAADAEARGADRVAIYLYYWADVSALHASLSSHCGSDYPEPCADLEAADQLSLDVGRKMQGAMERVYGPPAAHFVHPLQGYDKQMWTLANGGPRFDQVPTSDNRIDGLTDAEQSEIVNTILGITLPITAGLAEQGADMAAHGHSPVAARIYDEAATMLYRGNLFALNTPAVTNATRDADTNRERYLGKAKANKVATGEWYYEEAHALLRAIVATGSL